jgi:phosphoribosylglycinamide formyltransferase 1
LAGVTPRRVRTAILISGRGSNMAALLAAAADPAYPAEIVLVLSNRADAAGLVAARAQGIPTAAVESRRFGRDPPSSRPWRPSCTAMASRWWRWPASCAC